MRTMTKELVWGVMFPAHIDILVVSYP
jgi:hypothetical protein